VLYRSDPEISNFTVTGATSRAPNRAWDCGSGPCHDPGAGVHAAIAELELLHLATLGHRQLVDEFDETRHREFRQPRLAKFTERAFGERTAPPPDDGGDDPSSASSDGTGKAAALPTSGWLRQDLLHFERRDILAAAADGILKPVDEAVIAVSFAHGAVAGVKPAAVGTAASRSRYHQ
jgi:hypothetical protein